MTYSWKEEKLAVSELEVRKVQNLSSVSERQVEANSTGPRSRRMCGCWRPVDELQVVG